LHEYEISILNLLKKQKSADLESIQNNLGLSRDSATWAIENLSNTGYIIIERDSFKTAKLSDEGKEYLLQFPEEKFVKLLYDVGGNSALKSIQSKKDYSEIGFIWAKNNKWILLDKGNVTLTDKGKEIAKGNSSYNYREILSKLNSGSLSADNVISESNDVVSSLRKRDLLDIVEKGRIKTIKISDKGAAADISIQGIGALSREIISNKKWEKDKLRPYDINSKVEETYPARLHPMHEFMDIIRNSWFNMGFTEVSGPIIESAFWNFDALFSPQDHPTRDMQDTFFLKNPPKIGIEDIELMNRVKRMHVKNWKETWKEETAKQALLRTHTTSVSARYIKKFANNVDASYPVKLFSIGKVFRNESIDYKHLAELHQIDGIIIGTNLTLSNLIYTLKQFYSQLGMENIIIKPSYFPFVEPGLEVHYYDEKKKETIELCGGGVIRKEITKALGTNKTVLAWGGGVDRLMFKVLGINTLTELYRNDLGWLRKRGEIKI